MAIVRLDGVIEVAVPSVLAGGGKEVEQRPRRMARTNLRPQQCGKRPHLGCKQDPLAELVGRHAAAIHEGEPRTLLWILHGRVAANVPSQDGSYRGNEHVQQRKRVDSGREPVQKNGGPQQLPELRFVELAERGPTEEFLGAFEPLIAKSRSGERQDVGDEAADRGRPLVLRRRVGITLVDGIVLPALGQMNTHLVNQRGAQLWHVASPWAPYQYAENSELTD